MRARLASCDTHLSTKRPQGYLNVLVKDCGDCVSFSDPPVHNGPFVSHILGEEAKPREDCAPGIWACFKSQDVHLELFEVTLQICLKSDTAETYDIARLRILDVYWSEQWIHVG